MFTKLVVVSLVSFLIVFTSLGYTSARQSPQPTQNPPETIAEQNRKIIQAALEKSRIQTEGENGKPRLMVQLGHSGPVTSVAFSPDGQFVLTGSADNTARV
ncbi:MAG TPA: WD40 repeat domain-containing protein, partial [Acidobacteriota bacterium]|nr:WD40 repeat domain-containing protein [Acidobacteriota bacterium]